MYAPVTPNRLILAVSEAKQKNYLNYAHSVLNICFTSC